MDNKEFVDWKSRPEPQHTIYRDIDLENSEFREVVENAKLLWKQRCTEYLDKHGDRGSCVIGAGICVRYLGPRKRKWVSKTLISPTSVLSRVVGNLVWETSAEEIVTFLRSKGIDAFFELGRLD